MSPKRTLYDLIRWRWQQWDPFRPLRWWWQRRTWGFDERDLWSLDYAIIKFIYPRLKFFRERYCGGVPSHPTELDAQGFPRRMTPEEWEGILDEMLEGLQLVKEDTYPLIGEDHKKLVHSLDVFHRWFFHLWN